MDFFLSDRIYWIRRIFFSFSQFPPARNALACEAGGDETEKEASRSAGDIHLSCCASMVCHTTHLWFDPGALMCRLWRHGGFVLPSGKDKRRRKSCQSCLSCLIYEGRHMRVSFMNNPEAKRRSHVLSSYTGYPNAYIDHHQQPRPVR